MKRYVLSLVFGALVLASGLALAAEAPPTSPPVGTTPVPPAKVAIELSPQEWQLVADWQYKAAQWDQEHGQAVLKDIASQFQAAMKPPAASKTPEIKPEVKPTEKK